MQKRMKKIALFSTVLISLSLPVLAQRAKKQAEPVPTYYANRLPLHQKPYLELPLGSINPAGWLRTMLENQRDGATGQLDKLYPLVMNHRNGWLGGDGDQWERGPYWIDGLLPLAYILKDEALIKKVQPWVEWSINHQHPDGYFGPSTDYPYEPGIQRDNSRDWWPKMVMLKVLKQYYDATGDKRVITLMTKYFRYQLKELPSKPLGHWTFWAEWRGGDNLQVVYWLYNITGDQFLLDLAELIHKQTFNFTNAFLHTDMLWTPGSAHGVNLAQGFKEPVIYYQQHPEAKYLEAVKKGFADLRRFNGMAHGLYGADEALHGNVPTQGSELCTAVEMMYSLESMLAITGDVDFADHLEKIAFNALPSQIFENFIDHQYFQQANQVMATRHIRNFQVNHHGTDLCYGLLSGYPCCTSNMHQGWPKFTQNLWYATIDSGVAALVYAPSEVKIYVANQQPVTIKEETNYPFEESINFTINTNKKVSFPFHLRIPKWCKKANIKVNGETVMEAAGNKIVQLNREWKKGDRVTLELPMHIYNDTWSENSLSVQRGPLTYALKIDEKIEKVHNTKDPIDYGDTYYEIRPASPWNYALIRDNNKFDLEKKAAVARYPWSIENAPLILKTKAKRIPSWGLYNEMAGPLPFSTTYQMEVGQEEEITLIPYGCTRLRISQFPVVDK